MSAKLSEVFNVGLYKQNEDALRQAYGEIFVILNPAGDSYTGYYTPIELAVQSPFNLQLQQIEYEKIAQYMLPMFQPNWEAKSMVLVSIIKDCKTLDDRRSFLEDRYPLFDFLEKRLIAGGAGEYGLKKTLATLKLAADAYTNIPKTRIERIPISAHYEDKERDMVISSTSKDIPLPDFATLKLSEKDNLKIIEAIDEYLMKIGREMKIPKQIKSNILEYVSYTILMGEAALLSLEGKKEEKGEEKEKKGEEKEKKDEEKKVPKTLEQRREERLAKRKMEDEQPDVVKLINDPQLIPYARQVLTVYINNPVTDPRINPSRDYVKNFIYMLSLESHRLLSEEVKITENTNVIIPYTMGSLFYEPLYNPIAALNEYTNGVLSKLDMSKTYLTGSAMAMALYVNVKSYLQKEYGSIYHRVYNTPNEYLGRAYPNFYLPQDMAKKTDGFLLEDGTTSFGKEQIIPGADIDLMVDDTVSKAEFDQIAQKHYEVFKARWPSCVMERVDNNKGYNYMIVSTYIDMYRGFRNVEIYRGSINHIVSHHLPPVRAWYKEGQIFMEASCLLTQMNQGLMEDFHYFAGKKTTPFKTLVKYSDRGYRNDIVQHLYEFIKVPRQQTPYGSRMKIKYGGKVENIPRFTVILPPVIPIIDALPSEIPPIHIRKLGILNMYNLQPTLLSNLEVFPEIAVHLAKHPDIGAFDNLLNTLRIYARDSGFVLPAGLAAPPVPMGALAPPGPGGGLLPGPGGGFGLPPGFAFVAAGGLPAPMLPGGAGPFAGGGLPAPVIPGGALPALPGAGFGLPPLGPFALPGPAPPVPAFGAEGQEEQEYQEAMQILGHPEEGEDEEGEY